MPMKEFKGKKLDSYGRVSIFEGFPHNIYEVSKPTLPPKEDALAQSFIRIIMRQGSVAELQRILPTAKLATAFRETVIQPIDSIGMIQKLPLPADFAGVSLALAAIARSMGVASPTKFAKYVLDKSIGFRQIAEMMSDENLEEIMINGFDRNVFVFHKKHGMCKTNVVAKERGFVVELIMRIANTVSKQFSDAHPLLDARLPDGSRANATFSYVTPFGHSLTIRKFSKMPLSIVHLVENNTLSVELAAFLWLMVEGLNVDPMNIIVTGGAGSGKTTLLNILASFIPFSHRIISIEDTLELDLGERDNWIQMESKPKMKDLSEVKMDDLLKNSLRMRPDRLLVGEVRGSEAQTMFVAMDTGHRGILGTVHSNSAREMLLRFKSSPMDVPESMLPLLDLIVVMQRSYRKESGMIRRVKQVAEVGRMEDTVLLSNIFELNTKKGLVEKTTVPSGVLESLSERVGLTKNQLKGEMLVRQRILEWMLENGVKDRDDVEKIILEYYARPQELLEKLTGEI